MSMIRFQAYFKKGLRYLNGGVKTGLSHYVEDKNPKLFHVKVNIVVITITIITTIVAITMVTSFAGAKEANCASVYGDLLVSYEQVAFLFELIFTFVFSQFCRGDSYVLDVPESNKVLIWRGANSNRSYSCSF